MQNQYSNDERFKPLGDLAKKIYLNLKQIKLMTSTQTGGANVSDRVYQPIYLLTKSTYKDMQELKLMEKRLGITY